ncbi:aminotransferase class V-fold PLP-dependent enzyme [Candidatus Peregrinibacteria bacterium]|nr:aminotransferase class V-fold PLP-dependent enzyme [Candidatus Peregrinibacteria bacterium]
MQNLNIKPCKTLIYLDNAATTQLDRTVLHAMEPYLTDKYGNPSGLYSLGYEGREAIDHARKITADYLGCNAGKIIFTGSGTEANNLALAGAARLNKSKGNHIITTKIEHPSILETCEALEKEGFSVTCLNVDKYGVVRLDELKKALTPKTILVSIMYANNEIGTIEPIEEISKIIKKYKNSAGLPYLHTDACQAAGSLTLNVDKLGVDLMTLNAGKIHGPKGVGSLYIRKNTKIEPIIFGGHHEFGLRPGTENVAAIVGFGKALELAQKSIKTDVPRIRNLRDKLINGIMKRIDKVIRSGHPTQRLPNNVHISIYDIEGEALVLYLDQMNICCGTGSACSSKNLEPSHVLSAIGLPHEIIHGSLRLTLSKYTTKKEIDYVLETLPKIVKYLRSISPVNLKYKQ